jgi:hypothetical protein
MRTTSNEAIGGALLGDGAWTIAGRRGSAVESLSRRYA